MEDQRRFQTLECAACYAFPEPCSSMIWNSPSVLIVHYQAIAEASGVAGSDQQLPEVPTPAGVSLAFRRQLDQASAAFRVCPRPLEGLPLLLEVTAAAAAASLPPPCCHQSSLV